MKKITLIIILLLLTIAGFSQRIVRDSMLIIEGAFGSYVADATTSAINVGTSEGLTVAKHIYCVDSINGSDSNTGLGKYNAIKSIAKLNTLTPDAGDIVVFRKGQNWRGTVNLVSGVTYRDYGFTSEETPTLKGTSELSGFTEFDTNVYTTKLDSGRTNQVFVDGAKLELAKNTANDSISWMSIASVANTTTFTSTALIGKDWTGAYVHLTPVGYTLESRKITSCNSTTGEVTIASAIVNTLNTATRFFLSNDTSFLDVGEWVLDESDSTLYISLADAPSNHTIEISTIDYGFQGTDVDNVSINNFIVKGFAKTGIDIYNTASIVVISENVIVDNCDLSYNYWRGINMGSSRVGNVYSYFGTNGCIVRNSTITGTSGQGICGWTGTVAFGGGDLTITNNTITDIGLLNGIGLDGFGWEIDGATAIFGLQLQNSLISSNTINDVGYIGITFAASDTTIVKNNVVGRTDLALHDGGGIYAYGDCFASYILDNIVFDIGNPKDGNQDFGIYLDGYSAYLTVDGNTVYGCTNPTSYGLFLSTGTKFNVIKNNTLFGNTYQLFSKTDTNNKYKNEIDNNIIWVTDPTQIDVSIAIDNDSSYISIDGNYILNMFDINLYNGTYWTIGRPPTYNDYTNTNLPTTVFSAFGITDTLSTNLAANGTLDSNSTDWAGGTWVSSSKISTGGALRRVHSTSYGSATNATTGFTLGTTAFGYHSFDYVMNGSYTASKGFANFSGVGTTSPYLPLDSLIVHAKVFIPLTTTTSGSSTFGFSVTAPDTVYYDNLESYVVQADYIDGSDLVQSFINSTANDSIVTMPDAGIGKVWYDKDNLVIGATVELPAYKSFVAYKGDE